MLDVRRLFVTSWGYASSVCSLLISYRAQGREYQTHIRLLFSRRVESLSDLVFSHFSLRYNPEKPADYWIPPCEMHRMKK